MAARSRVGGVKKVFEHCEITWKIENYFLATFREKWIINSPEIYVREPRTKWKMFLTPDPKDEKSMFIHLQRLEYDSGPNSVWANWRMTLIAMEDNVEKEFHILKGERSFGNDEYQRDTLERETILKRIVPPFEDTFCIRIQFIVSHETVDETYSLFDGDYDLRTLQNFVQQHAVGKKYDLDITNGTTKIKAHREILCSRSRFFENIIPLGTTSITVDLDRMGFSNIIAYLYSGELEHVLSKPHVSLYDITKILKISELDLYYLPSLIKLNTAQDVQYNEFRWVIGNVSSKPDGTIIRSPLLSHANSKFIWSLELQITVVKEYMHMSISAKGVEPGIKDTTNTEDGTHRLPAFIQLVPMNGMRECFLPFRVTDFIEGHATFKEEKFFEIELSKIRSLLPDDMLLISFKIQILLSRRVSERVNRMVYFFSK